MAVGRVLQALGNQLQEEIRLAHYLPRVGAHPTGDELSIVDAELALEAAADHHVVPVQQHRVDLAGHDLQPVALEARRRAGHYGVAAILAGELMVLQMLLGLIAQQAAHERPQKRRPRADHRDAAISAGHGYALLAQYRVALALAPRRLPRSRLSLRVRRARRDPEAPASSCRSRRTTVVSRSTRLE